MTEQKNQLASLFAACWKDEALKARFMSDPKAVLAEYDMPVPDGMDVKVVENADNCVHITMPAPPIGDGDLSDEELSNAAGGVDMMSLKSTVRGGGERLALDLARC
jgi:hypothetical protein